MLTSSRRVCVFCGSSMGVDPRFAEAARTLGAALANRELGLVYGGAHVGLMGTIADAVLAAGGEVLGVIPASLQDREIAHPGLTELTVVSDMHERKKAMYAASTGFIALPGGYGTLEEVFEVTTWNQLGLHEEGIVKPVVLLDIAGFWAPMADFLDSAVDGGFVKQRNRGLVQVATTVEEALTAAAPNPL